MGLRQMFAKRLREMRELRGLSQTELAEKLGVSRGSISFYENGDRTPDIETLYKVSEFFGESPEYFLTGIRPENQSTHAFLGLSDEAIEVLKSGQENEDNVHFGRKLYMLDCLIRDMNDSDLLENLFLYIFENFALRIPEEEGGGYRTHEMISSAFYEGEYTFPFNANDIREIFLMKTYHDITNYRKFLIEDE